jgi:hypothetical protein
VATTTTTPTRLLHLFQILHSENSKRISILLELKQFFSIRKIQKVINSFGAQTESFSIRKIPKVFNSFGAQTDSSPFGKFKKFSIPLELEL